MWLPKDERKTLAFYYRNSLAGKNSYSNKDLPAERINLNLSKRGLIKMDILFLTAEMSVILTPDGMQLGQKYNSIGGTIAVWCAEHKWLWAVLGVIIAAIALVIKIFKG